MRKRSAAVTTEEEVAALTLSALNQQIAWARWSAEENASSASLRKIAFKRLAWFEEQRERLHGIAAPKRRF
jgi:hypothetical protein